MHTQTPALSFFCYLQRVCATLVGLSPTKQARLALCAVYVRSLCGVCATSVRCLCSFGAVFDTVFVLL